MTDAALEDWRELPAPPAEPVKRLASGAENLKQARERLADLAGATNTDRLAQRMHASAEPPEPTAWRRRQVSTA